MAKGGSVIGTMLRLPIYTILAIFAVGIIRLKLNGEPLSHIIPNLMMFTGDFEGTVRALHANVKIDNRVKYPPIEIPYIQAEDFDMEALRIATDNWRTPAVVKNFFKGTKAMEMWGTPEYLPSVLGKYNVPVVKNSTYNNNQMGRAVMPFEEAFHDIIINQAPKYLFFPVQSREQFEKSENSTRASALQADINKLVREDLELEQRLWEGFGTAAHKVFFGSQLVVGYGQKDPKKTTGTGWHCAVGNNYFAMVVGKKRWYFVDQRWSTYMAPVKGGKVNVQTVRRDLATVVESLPLRFGDIEAGDLLYNPDWTWHTIQNYEGLSLGVPIREVSIPRSMQNNAMYTTIVLLNKILEKFNIDIGGYPIPGHSLAKLWKDEGSRHEEL
uniref:Cupin-like domain-containing protein n=1 Tax=Phaeomonas parva TaxID=124430 RepID=A0A7S1UGQ9_9STRA|mmetsp:Transcript_46398/g.145166  ORF Transcript_46398/g.145166 Transcript_46398/m.145166 type:complete len:384 (+) Transcript_46398:163-1314(+)